VLKTPLDHGRRNVSKSGTARVEKRAQQARGSRRRRLSWPRVWGGGEKWYGFGSVCRIGSGASALDPTRPGQRTFLKSFKQSYLTTIVSDIAIFVLKGDVKLQLTNKAIWQLQGAAARERDYHVNGVKLRSTYSNIRLMLSSNVYIKGTSVVERIGLVICECKSMLT